MHIRNTQIYNFYPIETHVLIFFFQKICLQLWCVNPETGMCTTHHEPGAEGSSCGHEKVQIIFLKLCQGCPVHFVFLCQLRVLTRFRSWMTKSQLGVLQMSPIHYIKRCKQQKWTFKNRLGKQVFKNQNCNPFQSSSSLTIRFSLCTRRDVYTFF